MYAESEGEANGCIIYPSLCQSSFHFTWLDGHGTDEWLITNWQWLKPQQRRQLRLHRRHKTEQFIVVWQKMLFIWRTASPHLIDFKFSKYNTIFFGCLLTTLFAEEHQLEFSQWISEVARCRHFVQCVALAHTLLIFRIFFFILSRNYCWSIFFFFLWETAMVWAL